MENNELVSVIVAAFNVEKYIEECIQSILSQTYRYIELIVVDDCSTDNTLSICNSWISKDPRITVIHNETNSGVSKTRNIALNCANGKYVAFVDGDDALLPDCIEYMVRLIVKTDSDMCISKNCYHDPEEKQVPNDTIETASPIEATALLLSQKVDVGCWNKLYNKEFLDTHNIRFSEDLFYGEGLNFITTVSVLSKKVGIGNRKVYYYRRTNTESATTKFNIEKYRNGWTSLQRVKKRIGQNKDVLISSLLEHMVLYSINCMIGILQNNSLELYQNDYMLWSGYIHTNANRFLFNKYIGIKHKVKLIIMILFPKWFASYSLRKKKSILEKRQKMSRP